MFLFTDRTHRMLVRYDERIGHRYVPGQVARIPHERGGYLVRTNSQGFRSDTEFISKRGNRPRILVFGDSMTAGDGCGNSERFSDRLGQLLDVEVYNYGLSGSGTDQQLLIYEQLAKDVEADLVILAVYVENIERIITTHRPSVDRATGRRLLVPKPYFELVDGELELRHSPVPRERLVEGQGSNGVRVASGVADTARPWTAAINLQLRTGLEPAPGELGLLSGVLSKTLAAAQRSALLRRPLGLLAPKSWDELTPLRPLLQRAMGYRPLAQHYEDGDSEGLSLLTAIVRRFARGVGSTPFVIAPLPLRFHCLQPATQNYRKYFERLASSTGAQLVDVLDDIRELPFDERKRLSFAQDSHFSPFGHDVVARALAKRIALPARTVETPKPQAPRPSRPLWILGVSCFYHDSAACLLRDGEIVAAAAEERFSRVKNDRGFPTEAINYCLERGEVSVSELGAVAYYDDVSLTLERIMSTVVADEARGRALWTRVAPTWMKTKTRLGELLDMHFGYDGPILENLHHRSHAASAFFPSPFDDAAVLTVDGVGEWSTATIGVGEGSSLELLEEMRFPHSIGLLYSAFTQFTGFKVNSGEYKMMGLAPYGEPKFVDTILEELVQVGQDGAIVLNMNYFDFLYGDGMCGEGWERLFGGPARNPDARITRREMDIARSIQEVTERIVLRMAHHAHDVTGKRRLCMAGGVALNCVANGRLLREGPFDDLWIQPAAGDAGGALGAALDAHHRYFGRPRVEARNGRAAQGGSCLGPRFHDDEIASFLDTHNYPHRRLTDAERAPTLAKMLADGFVVGHFADGTEFGPRALGARSILGDPRNRDMQVKLNLKIKYRESFRPFAPAVLASRAGEYFELDAESPYMLIVAPVRQERRRPWDRGTTDDMLAIVKQVRSDVPAVTHVDYSARVQTVHPEDNPVFHELLFAFAELTGCPVLVNTSFNVRGEPIVNTPFDAYRCFMRTEMDTLVLGRFLLSKKDQPPWPEEGGAENEWAATAEVEDPALVVELGRIYDEAILPVARRHRAAWCEPAPTGWQAVDASGYPRLTPSPADALCAVDAMTRSWDSPFLVETMATGLMRARELVDCRVLTRRVGTVSDRAYVLF